MRITNLINKNNRAWVNQFVLEDDENCTRQLQSYNSLVVTIYWDYRKQVILHEDWNYSNTTLRAVNKFLSDNFGGEWHKKDIEKIIKAGEWVDGIGKTWTFSEER